MVSVNSASQSYVANSYINKNDKAQSKSTNSVASGKSVNKASDNAAGLAIATQLLGDVSTLRQASSNLVQGSAVLQTADGALEQTGNILGRMKELATQAQSGSLDAAGRDAINTEYQSLSQELGQISSQTSFNGQQLLNGSFNQDFQAGTSGTDVINADLSTIDTSLTGLGLTAGAGASAGALLTPASAAATSAELDTALDTISSYRAQTGALQSQFSVRFDAVEDTTANTIAAQSAIVDADIGQESSNLSGSKLLSEVAIAAAAQGNRSSASLLKLVR